MGVGPWLCRRDGRSFLGIEKKGRNSGFNGGVKHDARVGGKAGEVVEEVLASLGNFNDLDASNVLSFVLMAKGSARPRPRLHHHLRQPTPAEAADALG